MAAYDFTNKRFGKLTAIKVAKKDDSGHNYWQCQCDCGNTVIVRATELMNGKTTMCKDCKKQSMGILHKTKTIKKDNVSMDNGEQWLKNNNIPYYDVNNYDNILDLNGKDISIFEAPIVYKIVHAINSDLSYAENTYLGNGLFTHSLAEQINQFFHIRKQLDELSVCDWEVGEVIYTAPVYHLLTKKDRDSKISYDDVYSCLLELARKAEEHGNYYLAFPRICCGKDKLNWDIILQMILNVFTTDFNILLF